jgi:hypothetical protein
MLIDEYGVMEEWWWAETKLKTAADKTFEHNKLNMKLGMNWRCYEANLKVYLYITVFITTRVYFHGVKEEMRNAYKIVFWKREEKGSIWEIWAYMEDVSRDR